MNDHLYTIFTPRCPFCGHLERFLVNEELFVKITKFLQGEINCNIQDYLPEFSAEQREQLISGICPTCWETQFTNNSDL